MHNHMRYAWALAVVSIVLLGPSSAQAAEPTAEAMRFYRQQRYDEAAQQLQGALQQHPDDPALYYDLGTVAYAKGDYQAAEEALNKALASADAGLLGRTWYNLGNTHYRQGQMKEATAPGEAIALYRRALDDYRGAIRQAPNDKDARYNYELVERRMKSLMQRQQEKTGGQGTGDKGQRSKGEEQKAEGSEQGAEQGESQVAGRRSQAEEDQAQTSAAAAVTGEGEEEKAGGEQQTAESDQQQNGDEQEALQQKQDAESSTSGEQKAEELGGDQTQAAADEKEMSQQEAFWILDSMQQEERGVPRGRQQGPARERPVEQDW